MKKGQKTTKRRVSQDRKPTQLRYFLFYKPYGVLCQFTGGEGLPTLGDYLDLPSDVYPVGRLDADSEGLLLLTNDGRLKHRLLDPDFGHSRTYCVQIERVPDETALGKLRDGIVIEGSRTRRAEVRLLTTDPGFPTRAVPVRFRKNVPTAWIELTITEGRNRQVRKMTAAAGHPTLRLVRTSFHVWTLEGLRPGKFRELTSEEISRTGVLKRRDG
jgi:23S rRNA pseudouridine2457 synthase